MLNSPNLDDKNCNLNCNPNCNLIQDDCKSEYSQSPQHTDNSAPHRIPYYNLPLSAGSLGILNTETAAATHPAGYIQMPIFNGCEFIFPITGINMEPLIQSGDWIGVKPMGNIRHNWDFIQTGAIYLIITQNDRMIKCIEKTTDKDFIICSSPSYTPFKVYKRDIQSIYRIKAIARGF